MRDPRDIIIRPIISERTTAQMEDKKYSFVVDLKATKVEIRNAVEELFDVKVDKVNTMRMKGKKKRFGVHEGYRPDWKKAIVTLKPGSKKIPLLEGV